MTDASVKRPPRPHFSQPTRQLLLMLLVVTLTVAGGWAVHTQVEAVVLANPYLNGVIVAVFLIGVLSCFLQVVQLASAARWIEGYAANPGSGMAKAPNLLATLAALLRERGASTQIGATSSRSILDSVAQRLDEARDITRYIINLLIFLGLLGTFFGLATTVPAVVDTIRSLEPAEGEGGIQVFARLMGGLEAQLGGMGTAFSSSLLGLAGSLVVGLLELFAGHGQNRFYRELEEWLSSITRIGFASGEVDGGSFDTAVIAQVLDHMGEQMEDLQRLFVAADERQQHVDEKLIGLTTSIERLASKMERGEGGYTAAALERIALGQERLIEVLEQQRQAIQSASGEHVDAESRMRLRSIDVQLLRILEEMAAGRQESVAELRGELASLNRALRQSVRMGGGGEADPDDTNRRPGGRKA